MTGIQDLRLDLDALPAEVVGAIAEQITAHRAAMKAKRREILAARNDRPSILGVEMVSATAEAERDKARTIATEGMR